MTSPTKRMYVATVEIEMLVVAESAQAAAAIAAKEFSHEVRTAEPVVDDFTARVARYLPAPYTADDRPYGEDDGQTVSEWLSHNCAPLSTPEPEPEPAKEP